MEYRNMNHIYKLTWIKYIDLGCGNRLALGNENFCLDDELFRLWLEKSERTLAFKGVFSILPLDGFLARDIREQRIVQWSLLQ